MEQQAFFSNPALYRRMSEPFPSLDAARVASEGFQNELAALREKYKMTNVYCITKFAYVDQQGEEVAASGSCGLGDMFEHEVMLAMALGAIQAERQELVGRAMTKGIKRPQRGS
jgi:hypothetical protein